jgi:hypothetical protein
VSHSSYSDVFSISHVREHEEEIHPGDFVRTGPNLHPYYKVIAIDADRAWVRNVQTGADSLAFLDRCRLIDAGALAIAAE